MFKNDLRGSSLFFYITLINAIAYISTTLVRTAYFNPGYIRAIIVGFFIIWFLLTKKYNTKVNSIILIFLGYLFVLTLFSSNILQSFLLYLKVFLSMSMFLLGYYYVKSVDDLKKLNNVYVFSLIIFVLSVIFSLVFGVGYGYGEGDENTLTLGATGPNIAKNIVVIVLTFPSVYLLNYITLSKLQKWLLLLLFFVSTVIIIIALKRSALISLATGFAIYSWFSYRKIRSLKILFITVLAFSLTYPLFRSQINKAFESRSEMALVGEGEIEEESRFKEIEMVHQAFIEGNFFHKMFGSELFNDREFFGSRRMLHTDFATILNGSGLIGLLFYFIIPVLIFLEFKRLKKFYKNSILFDEILAVSSALLISSFILGISGTIQGVDLRALIFMYTGSCLGLLKSQIGKYSHGFE